MPSSLEPPRLKLDIDDFYSCYLNLYHQQVLFETIRHGSCGGGPNPTTCKTCETNENRSANCSNTTYLQNETTNNNIHQDFTTTSSTCTSTNAALPKTLIFYNESVEENKQSCSCNINKQKKQKRQNVNKEDQHEKVRKPKNQQKFKNDSHYVGQHSKRRSLFTRKNSNSNPMQSSMQINFPVFTFHTFVME